VPQPLGLFGRVGLDDDQLNIQPCGTARTIVGEDFDSGEFNGIVIRSQIEAYRSRGTRRLVLAALVHARRSRRDQLRRIHLVRLALR
jgi:hypothetical protein